MSRKVCSLSSATPEYSTRSLAIVFGAGKPQTGCLILPSDLAKGLSNVEIIEKVWPVIEQANVQAPTHSRLLPEMIEILPSVARRFLPLDLTFIFYNSHGTEIPIASKMSILRPACYAKFKDLIGTFLSFLSQLLH